MNDQQLQRYSRHILLPAIDIEGQQRLLAARVLVVGVGGLGSPVALYLASAGIGTLVLADGDTVDLTNLQRQIVHRVSSIGVSKAVSARQTIADINPDCTVLAIEQRLDGQALEQQIALADVVVDCSDNFATRHAINRACVAHKKPLVSGAAIGFDGQISVFDPRHADCPCYACVFPESAGAIEANCALMGVFSPIVGIIGSMQAAEVLKLIIACGTTLAGRLLLLDGLDMHWQSVAIKKSSQCQVC